MARTIGPISDGEADSSSRARTRGVSAFDDSGPGTSESVRPLDLEPESESPFLRNQRRVPARKTALPSRRTAQKIKSAVIFAAILLVAWAGVQLFERYSERSARFRIESSDQIDIAGTHNIARAQVLEVFGADIARNIFAVPLEDRKKQLEQIPWVESATLMRLLPNRLKVEITERRPIAYVEIGSRVALIDANGVIMEKPLKSDKYPFTVITGMSETEPLSTRAPRMKIFQRMMADVDAGGTQYSKDFEEVDLSDPDDVKVFVKDADGGVLVHLGAANFQDRYKLYLANVANWRQQVGQLRSVDLRYDHQVIVNPDGVPDQPVVKAPAPKASPVKPARAAHHRSRWHRKRK